MDTSKDLLHSERVMLSLWIVLFCRYLVERSKAGKLVELQEQIDRYERGPTS
jgi:hypothetical protein